MNLSSNSPKVSVIIPTHNRVHLIGRSIQSVLKQTYQDFEIIVVDDGSTDNTWKVIKEFQRKDKRIKYIKHDKNKGGSAARNTGIKASMGEYIAFQDSDDEWLSGKLEKQIEVFKSQTTEVGIVYSDMWRITGNKKKYFYSPIIMPKDKIIYKQALDYGISNIGIQTSLIKKEVFDKAGMFDEKLPRFIDLEFFIRLSKHYYFFHIKEPLVNYFDADKGISSNTKALVTARKLILEKYFEDIKKNKEILAKHYAGICISLYKNNEFEEAREYSQSLAKIYSYASKDKKLLSKHLYSIGCDLCLDGNFSEGRKYLLKAVKKHPANIKFLLKAFISFFGQDIYRKLYKLRNK